MALCGNRSQMGGAAWEWGAGRIPWAPRGDVSPGSRSARLGKWGSARVRRACIPGPGARRRCAPGAGAGWRLHSNGLRSQHTGAPLDPGRGREVGTRGAGDGRIQGSRGAWAVCVLIPALALRSRPAQVMGSPARGAAASARGGLSVGSGAQLALCPAGPRVLSRGGRGLGGTRRGGRGYARPRARNPSAAGWPGAGLPCLCVA